MTFLILKETYMMEDLYADALDRIEKDNGITIESVTVRRVEGNPEKVELIINN